MNLRPQLELAAAALQEAVERRDFPDAATCAGRYGALLRRAAGELPAAEAAQLVGEGSRRLESARRKVSVARACLGQRLRTLDRAARYRPPAGKAVHTWSIQV